MKKRAQLPNAQTYTIIFDGCAQSRHPKLAVAEATKIYHSMLNSSRLTPNTIHMNAVIRVCSRAGDMDSLFNIVATANEKHRAPDNWTYTTILNAIRMHTERPHETPPKDVGFHVNKDTAEVSITRAKALWQDALARWRNGQMRIDEPLVCAMGRILLMGDAHDNKDVLSLVEQTMNMPRFDRDEFTKIESGQLSGDAKAPDITTTQLVAASPRGDKGPKPVPSVGLQYAQPGLNSLSLILTALGRMRKGEAAMKYWNLFTNDRSIDPDSDNWYRLLRVLRVCNGSATVAELLPRMPTQFLRPETYRIAMEACVLDRQSENVFASAGKILDVMNKNLAVPDPEVLRTYMDVALKKRQFDVAGADAGDKDAVKFAFGRQIVRALNRLWGPLRLATNAASYPDTPVRSPGEAWAQTYNAQREIDALARRMMGAADKVVTEGMVAPDVMRAIRVRRNLLNARIRRFQARRVKMEPKLFHRGTLSEDNSLTEEAEPVPEGEVVSGDVQPVRVYRPFF